MQTTNALPVTKTKYFAVLYLTLLAAVTVSVCVMPSDAANHYSVQQTTLTLNGNAQTVGSRLRLTDGGPGETASAFRNTLVNVQSFTNDFSFQLTRAYGDGFTFTIQRESAAAVGRGGGGLGYSRIGLSAAVKFDLCNNAGEGLDSTGLFTNGVYPAMPASDMTGSGVNLHSGDVMNVHMTYDGRTLIWTITDPAAGAQFRTSAAVNIPSLVGANTAYVGFTAGTGSLGATQDILAWTYVPGIAVTRASQRAATPVFSPDGGTYTAPHTVTISDLTAGAKIHYTTDGSTPTASSTQYSGGILVSQTTTLNAIATASGMLNSATATSGSFNIDVPVSAPPQPTTAAARLYVLNRGPVVSIYDIDTINFPLIKRITLGTSTEEIRGVVASKVDDMMYVSYGCTAPDACTPFLMKFNLITEQIVWNKVITQGIDSPSISPDGRTLYMPTGEGDYTHSRWLVIDTVTGNVTGSIDSREDAPHNTIVNAAGTHVYMGSTRQETDGSGNNYLVEAAIPSGSIIRKIGPQLNAETRPFTIDAAERYAYIVPFGLDGFEVGDINTGHIIYKVQVQGFDQFQCHVYTTCSHGISLSPDGREIYLVDLFNNYVHVFDVTTLPEAAPTKIASIRLNHDYTAAGPWVTHSRDGRFVFVGDSGDVIETASRQVVGYLQDMATTKVYTEVDFVKGAVSFTPLSRSGVAY